MKSDEFENELKKHIEINVNDEFSEPVEIPEHNEILSAIQRNGKTFEAEMIFDKLFLFIKKYGCENIVPVSLIEQYSIAYGRFLQCEENVNSYGLLGKHPTIQGAAIPSPYIEIGQSYLKQVQQIWSQIYTIIKENEKTDNSSDNMVENLLRSKKRG